MNDRTLNLGPKSPQPTSETEEPAARKIRGNPIRIARGTGQVVAPTDAVTAVSEDDVLEEAIRRGVAMLCAEQNELAFFVGRLSKKD